jgi:hypothetical protein
MAKREWLVVHNVRIKVKEQYLAGLPSASMASVVWGDELRSE